jgi:hypothetical protein
MKKLLNSFKILFFVSFLACFTAFSVNAEDNNTFLSKQEVSKINIDVNIQPEKLQEEITQLNIQLDQLNKKLKDQELKNNDLQDQISVYKQNEIKNKSIELKTQELKELIARLKFDQNVIDDKDYEMSLTAIKLNNLSEASAYLVLFFLKEPTLEKYQPKEDLTQEQKDLWMAKFENTLERANFLLGEIKLLNGEFSDAVSYLAKSYILSKNSEIIIKSLLSMITSFSNTDKSQELCIAAQRFVSVKKQLIATNSNYIVPREYTDQVNNLVLKNSCDIIN